MGRSENRQHLKFRPRALALALACAGIVAVPAATSGAQTIEGLNSQIAGAQQEASSLGAAIEARSAELAATQARARAAAQREYVLSGVLARGQERERQLEADVAAAKQELAAARARLDRALGALAERLVAMYKSGMPDEMAVLLSSDGFDDLAGRAELLNRIQEADANLVARVRMLRDQVEEQLAAVEAAEQRANAFNERVAAAHAEIASVRADAESQAAALAAARQRQQAALASLQSQVSSWTAQVQRLEQVSAQQAQETVASWVGDYAIPSSIVSCESGGNYNAVNPSSGAGGAYQIIPSTWELYGGSGSPQNASKAEQDRIAAQIWADSGSAAWECAG